MGLELIMAFVVMALVGFAILLMYLWGDVRRVKEDLRNYRREQVRTSVGGRLSPNYPGFSEEKYWEEAKIEQAEGEDAPDPEAAFGEPGEKGRVLTLKPGEEQVLREILLEFLS